MPVDTTAPHGTLYIQHFEAVPDAYGLTGVSAPLSAVPVFADIDGDGDLDLFLGGSVIEMFTNIGTASNPDFVAGPANPFGLDLGPSAQNLSPTFGDLDGDGDLDAFVGADNDVVAYLENNGSATAPSFAGVLGQSVGADGSPAVPTLVDIDGDGDLDLFIGSTNPYEGSYIRLFTNTGSASSPSFTPTSTVLPVGNSQVSFFDMDNDGDLDAFVGDGKLIDLYENTGTASSPVFAFAGTNPFGLSNPTNPFSAASTRITVGDVNGDGKADALVENFDGPAALFLNEFHYVAPVDTTTPDGTYGAGSTITLTVSFDEAVYVDETNGTPSITLETGDTDREAVYSGGTGTNTLTFTYTVQAGDSTDHLDFTGANALALHGGTIRDGAGNDADLALSNPGDEGSLGAAANIAIDGIAPVATLQTDTLRPDGSATIRSSETGSAYLVNSSVTVTDLASILSSSGHLHVGGPIGAADTDSTLSLAGLEDGTYKLYTFDDAGNMSDASTGTVTVDTVAPRGTIGGLGALSAPIASAFGLAGAPAYAAPTFVDIDHDGDLDEFVGGNGVPLLFAENTGDATHPTFAAPVQTPFGMPNFNTTLTTPAFADIDGDGDFDAFLENGANQIVFVRNVGTASSPNFAGVPVANPFGIVDAGDARSAPAFADIDGDGDLDAFVANYYGQSISYFENTGSAANPSFVSRGTNPFGLTTNNKISSVAFGDFDGDGDLDAFVGMGNSVWFEENVGTSTAPSFAAPVWVPVNFHGAPAAALADIDGDGDLDLVVGNYLGDISLLRNDSVAPITTSAADGTYGVGSTIELSITFDEAVYVAGGIPTITLETGDTDRAAVYTGGSGTNTLTFAYTVMIGDHASDLNITGSSAFALNGATIRDAAGNNAVITLAEAGAQGSLAFVADIAIDSSPTATLTTASAQISGDAVVQSSAPGTAYLVSSHLTVTDVASITGAADNLWNSVSITSADSDTPLSLAGLKDGTYKLYTVDSAGGLSQASAGTVTVDNVAPHGAVQSPAAFPSAQYDPFGLTGGASGGRALVDIDGDGDLDAFLGANSYYDLVFQENTGDATHPSFGSLHTDPFGLVVRGLDTPAPVFADIDHDGDLDAFIGNVSGDIAFFENTGDATHPVFGPMQVDPFGLSSSGGTFSAPTLGDIDGDGDLDMLVGQPNGQIALYENVGNASSASFVFQGDMDLGGATFGYGLAYPALVDIDGDGDLDLYYGAYYGSVFFARNTGTATDPVFGHAGRLNINDLDFYGTVRPTFGDIDGDGDLDMILSDRTGNTVVRMNSSQYSVGVTTTNADGVYGVGAQIHIDITFNENVYVDAAGTPTITMETGDTDRDAIYVGGSGTKTLHFTYTVQAGDSSPDLDIASAILWLNGSTIQDAAGNDAVIDLAAPGSTGSLSANADIVIDGLPDPVATLEQGTYANTTSATVQSSRVGTAYLVNSHVTVTDVASITAADDDQWNSVGITDPDSGTPLDLAGLADGTYVLYTVSDTGRISAASSDSITITSSLTFTGTAGNDSITGTIGGDDTIRGLGGNDVLNGLSGNDFLDGGAGNDSLYGGDGNDILKGNTGADLMSGGDGNDTYYFDNAGDTIVEGAAGGSDTVIVSVAAFNATMSGASYVENIKTTYAGGSSLDGNALANVITGGAGGDTLIGEGGNDILNGGAGADTMIGGDGSDRYYVDDTNDVTTETNSDSITGGIDTVYSSASAYTLGANIEYGVVSTGAGAALMGNELNNKLTGAGGNDSLSGGAGNDIIDGGGGADTMVGGDGNDRYYVDNTNDVIVETSTGGVDTVYSSASSYTLADNVENGVVAIAMDGQLTGNGLDNKLTGNVIGNIVLDGGAGNDTLDSANIYSFDDTLIGGDGNDTFYVHSFFDEIIENVGGGTDTAIDMGGHFALSVRGANVENLKTTFAGTAFLTGNDLNNAITGFTGNDVLFGLGGNDVLNGGAGDDTMTGGTGNDIYYVDSIHDVVSENVGEGTDTVITSIANYTLTANVENLKTTYGGNASLFGNNLNNVITGGIGNDSISGSGGNDKLTGGAGADTFIFSDLSGRDTITDFSTADHDTFIVTHSTNGLNFATGADVLARASDAADGAVIDLGNGNTVKLVGVFVADLHASDFSIATESGGSDIV